jgi:hypothetical protein
VQLGPRILQLESVATRAGHREARSTAGELEAGSLTWASQYFGCAVQQEEEAYMAWLAGPSSRQISSAPGLGIFANHRVRCGVQ